MFFIETSTLHLIPYLDKGLRENLEKVVIGRPKSCKH